MKTRHYYFLIAAVGLGVFAIQWHPNTEFPRDSLVNAPSHEAVLARLISQRDDLEPNSPAAGELENLIAKVKRKGALRVGAEAAAQENPGLFFNALADIKRARDGTTYKPNYQVKAYNKARAARKKAPTPLPWTERGPINQGGRSRAIVLDPSDAAGNTFFTASVGGGVWKTSDNGATWEDKSQNMIAPTVATLAICQSNPNIMYAGTGIGYGTFNSLVGTGIWKSTDKAESWFQLESSLTDINFDSFNRIVVDPGNPDLVLVCGNSVTGHGRAPSRDTVSGIYRSVNGGQSWTRVFDPDPVFGTETDNRVQQIITTPNNFNVLYASVNEIGVIKSTDAGLTWTVSADHFGQASQEPPSTAGISVRSELAISPTDPSRVYASVERPAAAADLYMSRDAGASWQLVEDTGDDPNWFNLSPDLNGGQGWYDNTIAVHPSDPNRVYVGGTNLYQLFVNPVDATRNSSMIGFWLPDFDVPFVHADHHWLELVVTDPATQAFKLLTGNDGGVARQTEDGEFVTGSFLNTVQFYGVDKQPGASRYLGGTQDNATMISDQASDGATTWSRRIGGDGFESLWHGKNPDLMLGTAQFGNIFGSIDGGDYFQLQMVVPRAPFVTKLANSRTDTDLVFTIGGDGVYRSDDFGLNWELTPLTENWRGERSFSNVEVSDANPRVVWITSRLEPDATGSFHAGIHVSTDRGLSFREVGQNMPFSGLTEACGIATDPKDINTAYLLFAQAGAPKLLKTEDTGQTWTDLSAFSGAQGGSTNGFPEVPAYAMAVMPFDTDILWVGTEIGLFISEDGGASWEMADNGLPPVPIFQLRVVEDQVLAATYGRGLWTVTLPELEGNQPPLVTLSPRVGEFIEGPRGFLVHYDLRSAYDRSEVWIDGSLIASIPTNEEPLIGFVVHPFPETQRILVTVKAFKDGETLISATRSKLIRGQPAPARAFISGLNRAADSGFTGRRFQTRYNGDLSGTALHSLHTYPSSDYSSALLRTPLIVPAGGAILAYDDIALVEPGAPGSVFPEPAFTDYVIVEGTKNGLDWVPLVDGYDARANPGWLDAFSRMVNPTDQLFVHHEIDVGETFQPGDQILIRFRLFSDEKNVGWGWVIDNLEIFPDQGFQAPNFKKLIFPWISQNQDFESLFIANNTGPQAATVSLVARRERSIVSGPTQVTIPAFGFLKEAASSLFPIEPGSGFAVELQTDSRDVLGSWVTNNLTAATGASPSLGVAVDPSALAGISNLRVGTDLLFGYLPVTDGFISAPVLVNTGKVATDVTLRFYQSDGTLLLEDSETLQGLPPNRPFARVVHDLIPSVAEDVMMTASSSGAAITGVSFVFNDQGETAIGNASTILAAAEGASTNLLYAWISNNEAFESHLIASNQGGAEARVTLTARRSDGTKETINRTIPARGFLRESAATLFQELGEGTGYSVQLRSTTAGIQGRWVTHNLDAASGRSPSQGVAVPIPEPGQRGSQLVGAEVLFGFLPIAGGFLSAPVLVNIGAEATDVTLEFYNSAGDLLFSDTETLRALPPLVPFATVANSLLENVNEDVQMIARAVNGLITGVAFVFNEGLEPAIGNVTATDL